MQAVYLFLAQEGVLVGELAEEIVARAFQHRPLPAGDGLPSTTNRAPVPSAALWREHADFSLSSP